MRVTTAISLTVLLAAQILSVNSQGRGPTRNRSGWANNDGLNEALRNIGTDAGDQRGRPNTGAGSDFNVDEFLNGLNGETGQGNGPDSGNGQGNGQGRGTGRDQPTEEPATAGTLTRAVLRDIEAEFARLFEDDPSKISRYVQMGFHICIGGCDGCLDTDNGANAGLVPHYAELRRMYVTWQNVLSLADYAVISAYQATKAGVERNADGCTFDRCTIDFTFTSGRQTCANPDSPPKPEFPKGEDIHTPAGLMTQFGLTSDEMVALMGCHSLGRAHVRFSGFSGAWDLTPTVLDNGYFQAMTRVTWTQEFRRNASANQWVGTTTSGTDIMMLHADMILQHDFEVTGNRNRASCVSTEDCPLAPNTAETVDRFARDMSDFRDTLALAFTKMCNTATFDNSRRRVFN